ncbi:MAG TPA: hypothetical protein VK783_14595 [Bacteroidia bacterium]|nr:hypothetical protein [Bacteroidia bacterium]
MDEITLPYVSVKYTAPIVYYTYSQGIELGFPEVKELIMCAEKLSGHKPYVTFADARNLVTLTNEGKRLINDMSNMPLFRGRALLVKNDLYKRVAEFVAIYNKPQYPFKAFTDEQEAIDWLLTLPL